MNGATVDQLKYGLAIAIVVVFVIFLGALFFFQIPETNRDILLTGAGVLFGAMTTIISYVFGSSQGSADKQNALDRVLKEEAKK